jgi:hypothetical protein
MESREEPHSTIRMDDDYVRKLLDRMDAEEQAVPHDGRKNKRSKCRIGRVVVCVQGPGAVSSVPYLVHTRNISRRGLSFLHGGFLHIGTRCRLRLLTIHGSWRELEATVVRCRYLEKNLHEVGVRFALPVDPSSFSS